MRKAWKVRGSMLAGLLLVACALPVLANAAPPLTDDDVARVNGEAVAWSSFVQLYNGEVRQKFYHARPQEEDLAKFRQELAERMVTRVLLRQEAVRQGLQADAATVAREIEAYEKRYGASPQWQHMRAQVLPQLTARLEEDSLLQQLEAKVRTVADPSDGEVRDFYQARPELFTEPEKLRVSLILLSVDPSAPSQVWQSAREEGERIAARLKEGANFAELARLHSRDVSADDGGDLGYLHRGMLPEAVEQALEPLNEGEIAGPLNLLEGIGIFRLAARKPKELHGFDLVKQRAAGLLRRERQDAAWRVFTGKLRAAADVVLNQARLGAAGSPVTH